MLFAFGLSQIGMLWWLGGRRGAAVDPSAASPSASRSFLGGDGISAGRHAAAIVAHCDSSIGCCWLIRTAIIVLLVIAVAGPYVERLGGDCRGGQAGSSRDGARRLLFDGLQAGRAKPLRYGQRSWLAIWSPAARKGMVLPWC